MTCHSSTPSFPSYPPTPGTRHGRTRTEARGGSVHCSASVPWPATGPPTTETQSYSGPSPPCFHVRHRDRRGKASLCLGASVVASVSALSSVPAKNDKLHSRSGEGCQAQKCPEWPFGIPHQPSVACAISASTGFPGLPLLQVRTIGPAGVTYSITRDNQSIPDWARNFKLRWQQRADCAIIGAQGWN